MPNKTRQSKTLRRRTAGITGPQSETDTHRQPHLKAVLTTQQLLPFLGDFVVILPLVFGGCCANVWSFEKLLVQSPRIGSAMTFSQMLFIAVQTLPSFLTRHRPDGNSSSIVPRLKPRQVPLRQWVLQVILLTSGSLLNNWAFAYRVPLSLQIVFRSSGLAVSMLFGRVFLKRHYSILQVASVSLVTAGVFLATLSRPSSAISQSQEDAQRYFIGVLMLTVSLFLTGALGMLQEQTYRKYGPCWKEGVFYTHFLSLPIFAFIVPDIKHGFRSLAQSSSSFYGFPMSYVTLLANLLTQLLCVNGVNQLTSRVSSVSANLVLTTRKAISLSLSVWLFENGWNTGLGVGAGTVFFGSMLYAFVTARKRP